MTEKTQIKQATLDDLDDLTALFDAYRVFYACKSDPLRAHDWLRARIGNNESTVLLARVGGSAAGFVQLYPMYSSVHTARIWILNDLFVDPAHRRAGIAQDLLDAAKAFARDDGARAILLETNRDNAAARALYQGNGWSEDDTQWYSLKL
jgi:ribosomal protein S18 acetylase RimI-like enzyme